MSLTRSWTMGSCPAVEDWHGFFQHCARRAFTAVLDEPLASRNRAGHYIDVLA